MGTNLVDVREKIDLIDEKILNLLLDRMMLMPQVADAKYVLSGKDLKIRRPEREKEMYIIFKEKAGRLAKSTGVIDSDIFEKLILDVAKKVVNTSCLIQQDYLKKEYDLDLGID